MLELSLKEDREKAYQIFIEGFRKISNKNGILEKTSEDYLQSLTNRALMGFEEATEEQIKILGTNYGMAANRGYEAGYNDGHKKGEKAERERMKEIMERHF